MYFKTFTALILSIAAVLCPPLFAANTDIDKLADDNWLHLHSTNFDIITDLDEEKGRHLIKDLEAYRYFSIEMMHLSTIDNLKPLKILAISSTSNFKKLGFPDMFAGVFSLDQFGYSAIANVNNYTTNLKTSNFGRQVLFHEYNHFLVRFTQNSVHYPMWYDEGMADYWGSFRFDGEKIYLGDAGAIEFRTGGLFGQLGGMIFESEKLFKTLELPYTSKKESDKAAVSRFYAQSFFLIHYFNSSLELRASLKNYLKYFNNGYSVDSAFTKAFNLTYPQLDKAVKKYVLSNLMKRVISLKEGNIVFPETTIVVNKLNQATFYMHVSEMLANYGVIEKPAVTQLLEKNIELNPTVANAKMLLISHNLAANPKKIIDELEKTDSNNAMLLAYKGDTLRNNANLLHDAGIANWQENMKKARVFYRRAIKADPYLPLAYIGLGNVYRFMPTTEPLQEGVVGLTEASLYNRDESTFASLANILIRIDKGVETLPALRNAVSFSKEKEKSNLALILDAIELLKDVSLLQAVTTADGLMYSSDTRYIGNVINNKPDGIGKLIRPNSSYYEGAFVNGVMHGQGKIITAGGFIYQGEFQKGIARGKGKIIFPDGLTDKSYEGNVDYGIPSGKGISISTFGKYEGDFWYGNKEGKGLFTSSNDNITFQGNWVDGLYKWPEINDSTFYGNIDESGKRTGNGVCLTPSTSKIEWCSFKEGVRQTNEPETNNN